MKKKDKRKVYKMNLSLCLVTIKEIKVRCSTKMSPKEGGGEEEVMIVVRMVIIMLVCLHLNTWQ